MDFKLNYETMLKLTNNEIMDLFEQLTNFNLFSMNISWRKSREYILKLKGQKGDVVITWI